MVPLLIFVGTKFNTYRPSSDSEVLSFNKNMYQLANLDMRDIEGKKTTNLLEQNLNPKSEITIILSCVGGRDLQFSKGNMQILFLMSSSQNS